jgi:hypothetical protein
VIILIDLSQGVANLDMIFIVAFPMLFTAVRSDSTIRTLKGYSSRRSCFLANLLSGLGVAGGGRYSGLLVTRVRTVCVISGEKCALAHLGYGRFGEGME